MAIEKAGEVEAEAIEDVVVDEESGAGLRRSPTRLARVIPLAAGQRRRSGSEGDETLLPTE